MPIRFQLQLGGVIAFAALLGACSGGSSNPSSDPTNIAPLIAGTPPTSVVQGAMYSFAPTASDQNGDSLVYRIEIRGVKESAWQLLKDGVKEKYLSWDSTAFPDGESNQTQRGKQPR